MGGEREGFLEGKEKDAESGEVMGTVVGAGGQKFRYHESGGQVHFHDDAAKLKAAVPKAEWWKAWEGLKIRPGRWDWVDTENDTYLVIETQIVGDPPGIEAFATLTKMVAGSNFKALNKFTRGK